MKIIVATEKNWGIGKDNQLLVHLPGDLKFFKEQTTGKVIILGRKTLETFPGGRPLPNRVNVIVSGNPEFQKDGCIIASSVEDAVAKSLEAAGDAGTDGIMVCGGASIYEQMLPLCDTCIITRMDQEFESDRFFPNLDQLPNWQIAEQSEIFEENGVTYQYIDYINTAPKALP